MTEFEYIDFTSCKPGNKFYDGASGRKQSVEYGGKNYMLKFAGGISSKEIKYVLDSYSNAPLCEYIGSHIYSFLGIPVHNTILGTCKVNGKDKLVVACEDFNKLPGDQLISFAKIKTTFIASDLQDIGSDSNGTGTDFAEVLSVVQEHPVFEPIREEVKDRFWDMFVIDALIANSDRNNGNWGLIEHLDGKRELSPVFDNGGCLHNTWDDNKVKKSLNDYDFLEQTIIPNQVSVYTEKGKRINPSHRMESLQYEDCNKAVLRNIPKIKESLYDIDNFIDSIPENINNVPCISSDKKKFYKQVIHTYYEDCLLPVFEKLKEKSCCPQR